MPETDPRRLALDVLSAVEKGQWSDEALAHALDDSALGDADRGLATRLVYGTLARQRTLDHWISCYSARPLDKLDKVVVIALRLGFFQMGFLDRVPDHAAVMTSVELVARQAASAKGFVNALLRRAQREGLEAAPESPVEKHLGVLHSHPDWLVRLWLDELGAEETEALLIANNDVAPTCYRALGDRDETLKRLAELGVEARPGLRAPTSILLSGPSRRLDGLAVPQGEASQLVVEMLEPAAGERILDACAAPGGKTAFLASRVGSEGRVVACDPSEKGGRRFAAVLAEAGVADRVEFHPCGIARLEAEEESFDAVLVDAPCSGLGTLRQHPEIRWRRRPGDLLDLAKRQADILATAARFVKPGGRLVYSTCTLARVENDDIVAAFLLAHDEFSREEPTGEALSGLCDDEGVLRTWPHRDGLDGFFAVRLRRRG